VSSGQNDDWLQPSKGEAPFSGLSGNANATYSINKPLSHRSYEYLQAMGTSGIFSTNTDRNFYCSVTI